MKVYSLLITMMLALFANVVVAQDVDSLAPKSKADSLVVAADSKFSLFLHNLLLFNKIDFFIFCYIYIRHAFLASHT